MIGSDGTQESVGTSVGRSLLRFLLVLLVPVVLVLVGAGLVALGLGMGWTWLAIAGVVVVLAGIAIGGFLFLMADSSIL